MAYRYPCQRRCPYSTLSIPLADLVLLLYLQVSCNVLSHMCHRPPATLAHPILNVPYGKPLTIQHMLLIDSGTADAQYFSTPVIVWLSISDAGNAIAVSFVAGTAGGGLPPYMPAGLQVWFAGC